MKVRVTLRVSLRTLSDLQRVTERVGETALEQTRIDYDRKSRGQTGMGGVRWDQVTEAAILKRAQRQPSWKLSASLDPDQKRAVRQRLIAQARNGLIGVDKRYQLASLQPGYGGPDGQGGNVFEIDNEGVTVGVNRDYSHHFDSLREIFPDDLPAEFVQELEAALLDGLEEFLGD